MALDTYPALKLAVADWLNKAGLADVDAKAADFIALAEAEMSRDLDTREMTGVLLTTISDNELALPCDFGGVRSFSISGVYHPLQYVTPEALDRSFCVGRPTRYTITDRIIFDPSPSGEYEVRMRYRKRLAPLSASVPANWLLRKHPDAYLYGALAQAMVYFRDDERSLIASRYANALQSIRDDEKRTAYPSTLNTRARSLG